VVSRIRKTISILVEGAPDEVRVVCFSEDHSVIGFLKNGTIAPVKYEIVYFDSGGPVVMDKHTLPPGEQVGVQSPNPATASFGFVDGERVVLRVLDGLLKSGDGLTFEETPVYVGDNIISQRVNVGPGRTVLAAPPEGKMWQVPVTSFYPCGASFVAINRGDEDVVVDCYVVSGDSEVLLTAGDRVEAGKIDNIFSDTFFTHMYPYPARLEVEVVEGNPVNLLVACLFSEFDMQG